jgi:hypothetical protein
MSTVAENGATFKILNAKGVAASRGTVGASLGTWSHSKTVGYSVYAIDFTVPSGDLYKISVSGPAAATSPTFAVDSADKLYSGLLLTPCSSMRQNATVQTTSAMPYAMHRDI